MWLFETLQILSDWTDQILTVKESFLGFWCFFHSVWTAVLHGDVINPRRASTSEALVGGMMVKVSIWRSVNMEYRWFYFVDFMFLSPSSDSPVMKSNAINWIRCGTSTSTLRFCSVRNFEHRTVCLYLWWSFPPVFHRTFTARVDEKKQTESRTSRDEKPENQWNSTSCSSAPPASLSLAGSSSFMLHKVLKEQSNILGRQLHLRTGPILPSLPGLDQKLFC